MLINNCEQGSQEWLDARAGFVSASNAGILLTPTGKPSKGSKIDTYANKLIAERIIGKSTESGFQSDAMARGVELEEGARGWYEMATGLEVKEVGLIESGDLSCSPDGLIFEDGKIVKGLEIKCPLASTHIGYLLKGVIPNIYIPQVQLSMLVCEINEWDFLSYHPDLEPLLITVNRDEEWIDAFNEVLTPFIDRVNEGVNTISQAA